MTYAKDIQNLVNTALAELTQQHQLGKCANTPLTNSHFLARWVTKQIKMHRFPSSVKPDLIRWQKQARSQGSQFNLVKVFEDISALYVALTPNDDHQEHPILDTQIEDFMEHMESLGWEVINEFDLEKEDKVQIFTTEPNSFILCAQQCQNCFDGANLNKPMSFFVRGNHAVFVQEASSKGFLLHKQTDYKSRVKYHGEYRIYPNNLGPILAELPLHFTVDKTL